MTRTTPRSAVPARLVLPLCLLALALAAPAGATGETRVDEGEPHTVGDTTFQTITTEQNFGTEDAPDWRRIERREIKETPREGESHIVDREISIRRYEGGSRRVTETVDIVEVSQPVMSLEPTLKSRSARTVTYGEVDGRRTKVSETREQWEVVEVDDYGQPRAEGTRVTKTRQPDGSIKTTREVMDRRGRWVAAPASEESESESETSEQADGKKAAPSKAPTNVQKGLPTTNPGQRGMIPDVPHQKGYGGKSPPPSLPKGKY